MISKQDLQAEHAGGRSVRGWLKKGCTYVVVWAPCPTPIMPCHAPISASTHPAPHPTDVLGVVLCELCLAVLPTRPAPLTPAHSRSSPAATPLPNRCAGRGAEQGAQAGHPGVPAKLGWAGLGLRPEGWWAAAKAAVRQCTRPVRWGWCRDIGCRPTAGLLLTDLCVTCAAAAAKRPPPSPARPRTPPPHPCLHTGHQCTAVQEAGGRRPALRRRYPGRFHYWHRSVSGMAGKHGRWLACAPAGLHPAHLLHCPHSPHPAKPSGLPPCPPNPPTHPSPCLSA